MFSPAGIIIYKGAFYLYMVDGNMLMNSLCAYTEDDDLYSPRIPGNEKGRIPTSIRKRSRLHQSGESIFFSLGVTLSLERRSASIDILLGGISFHT